MDDNDERTEPVSPTWPTYPELTGKAWRERALTRVIELSMILDWFQSVDPPDSNTKIKLDNGIRIHLNHAYAAITTKTHFYQPWPGPAAIERIVSHLDAAEINLLRRAPVDYFIGQYMHILAQVRHNLPEKDVRRVNVESLASSGTTRALEPNQIEAVLQALSVANANARSAYIRVVSFRMILIATAMWLTYAAIAVGVWGTMQPTTLQMCFEVPNPPSPVCPTGDVPTPYDIVLLELIGVLAAMLSGTASILRLDANTTPLGLPVAVALLKLPVGALTAVIGLILLQADFIPGFSALDSSAQILAYAAIFGASQQLITHIVDRKADAVLQDTPNAQAV